jgi:hypothetical protein
VNANIAECVDDTEENAIDGEDEYSYCIDDIAIAIEATINTIKGLDGIPREPLRDLCSAMYAMGFGDALMLDSVQ